MAEGLVLDDLVVTAGGREIVRLAATVPPGRVTTVMGPSGSGKSTLLAAIVGTLAPAFRLSGRVLLDGRDLTPEPPERRRIGILFQDPLLFPHMSVGDNLAFGLAAGRDDRGRAVAAALAEVGLDGYAGRDPATLSGGQRARVALMRTLLSEPRALLLDEPFSGLDRGLRARVRQLVFTRATARRLPVLLVTHDPEDAEAAAGPVVEIAGADRP
jgi:putative thiamine transport system ATP-binding protein